MNRNMFIDSLGIRFLRSQSVREPVSTEPYHTWPQHASSLQLWPSGCRGLWVGSLLESKTPINKKGGGATKILQKKPHNVNTLSVMSSSDIDPHYSRRTTPTACRHIQSCRFSSNKLHLPVSAAKVDRRGRVICHLSRPTCIFL